MQEINQRNSEGNQEGYWEEFHQDGSLWAKTFYKNGQKHGYRITYDYDGSVVYFWHFVNDRPVGLFQVYKEIKFYAKD